jgi:hypothetical protein
VVAASYRCFLVSLFPCFEMRPFRLTSRFVATWREPEVRACT